MHQIGLKVRGRVLGALALLFLAACSSKNPDALTGLNVDENLAVMDANEAVKADLAAANGSKDNATSADEPTTGADRSAKTAGTKVKERGSSDDRVRSSEVNAVATGEDSSPQANKSSSDDAQDSEDQTPNAM